jgi:hypothetical protein
MTHQPFLSELTFSLIIAARFIKQTKLQNQRLTIQY